MRASLSELLHGQICPSLFSIIHLQTAVICRLEDQKRWDWLSQPNLLSYGSTSVLPLSMNQYQHLQTPARREPNKSLSADNDSGFWQPVRYAEHTADPSDRSAQSCWVCSDHRNKQHICGRPYEHFTDENARRDISRRDHQSSKVSKVGSLRYFVFLPYIMRYEPNFTRWLLIYDFTLIGWFCKWNYIKLHKNIHNKMN